MSGHRHVLDVADACLSLVLFVTGLWFVLGTPFDEDVVSGPLALNIATVALFTLPLAVRRRWPLAVLCIVFGTIALRSLVAEPLEIYTGVLAGLVASYSVAAYGTLRQAVIGLVALIPALAVAAAMGTGGDAAPELVPSLILNGVVWTIGRVAGTRYAEAWTLDRRREEEAREAVIAERERIARELHDSVSHSLAVIAMQAGGAEGIVRADPERAAASLLAIERSAREGLTEMRRMLDLLSPADQSSDLAPAPGVAQLPALVGGTLGGTVTMISEGEAREVPPSVDLSAYRIVQEALTNVTKHAGSCRAHVKLCWLDGALELEITDDGRGTEDNPGHGVGRGLIGMRERVSLVGGELQTGRTPSGGFRVWALLPTGGSA